MQVGTSFDAAPPRKGRSALGRLLVMWGALPRVVRRFAADFAAVFAEEGREVPHRLAWIAIPAVIGGALLAAAWLLACVATASWLAATYGWRWEMALYLVALANVVLALIAVAAAYRALKAPLFPFTSYELHRLRSGDARAGDDVLEGGPPLDHAGPKERALMRSEAELEARLSQVRQATPALLTTPSVIAATAGIGLCFGLLTAKRKARVRTGSPPAAVPLSRQLLNIAFGQLSSLAVAAAMREFQRRAGSGGRYY
jgi:MFS family permease